MHPESFGKYRIIRKLAGGGMGRVYLAREGDSARHVALKLIDVAPDPDSQDVLAAERRGAELQKRLSCVDTRVVRIYDAGERDGYFYIAMEYVEGADLAEVMNGQPMALAQSLDIGSELLGVLASAHSFRALLDDREYHGIVHGDIKPRNIRISPQGRIKLLDFGIAKALSLTRRVTQNHFGSVPYSSPERLLNSEVDARSDLWSVGVLLFEMLTGKRYFQADSAVRLEQVIRNYRAPLPSLQALPDGIRPILIKALDPRPERRYASAEAFQSDLESVRIGRPLTIALQREEEPEDEATRRTTSSALLETIADEGATRRTTPSAAAAAVADVVTGPLPSRSPGPPPLPVTPKRPPALPSRPSVQWLRIRFGIQAFIVLVAISMSASEIRVWRQGHALEEELNSDRLTDLNTAWDRYEALATKSHLPMLLSGPRSALKEKLTTSADRVIREYRDSETPTVREGDWQRAKGVLAHAHELSPRDKEVRGKLALCEAHLLRIDAESKKQGKLFNEAKAKFEESREFMSHSPDPYLGLARLYVYGLKDVEQAEDSLKQAGKHGYRIGRREKVQLADAYRLRADHWLREAARVKGMPQQRDYLRHGDDDYAHAESLYQDVAPFGNAGTMLRRLKASRDRVAQALQELEHAPAPPMSSSTDDDDDEEKS